MDVGLFVVQWVRLAWYENPRYSSGEAEAEVRT